MLGQFLEVVCVQPAWGSPEATLALLSPHVTPSSGTFVTPTIAFSLKHWVLRRTHRGA